MSPARPSSQQGLSLIELMIAMTLSLIVLAAATSSYVAGQRTSRATESRLTMQQDARAALAILARDLRMAGVFGCAVPAIANVNRSDNAGEFNGSGVTLVQHYPTGDVTESFDQEALGVRVAPATGSAWLAGSALTPLSNLIVVQFGQGNAAPTSLATVTRNEITLLSQLTAHLPVERSFHPNSSLLALASCSRVDFLKVDGTTVQRSGSGTLQLSFGDGVWIPLGSNNASGIQGHHEASLDLMRLVSRAYLVGRLHGQTGLYQFEIGEDGRKIGPIEIAANVSGLSMEFGTLSSCENSGSVSISYHSQPADWRKVDLVRLTLTMQDSSPHNIAKKELVRSYSSTVALRGSNLCIQQASAYD